jgi:hypothetical protein
MATWPVLSGADEASFVQQNLLQTEKVDRDGAIPFTASPTAPTIKLTDLSDGYIPYHVSDAAGLANSPISIGTNVLTANNVNVLVLDNTVYPDTLPAIGTGLIAVGGEIWSRYQSSLNRGILRLSAGGGVNAAHKSGIDIVGYADTDIDQIRFFTAGAENMRIKGGSVLIGATAAVGTEKLSVAGSILTPSVTFTDGDTTPSVSGSNSFYCNYTNTTTITNFDDGVLGQIITISFLVPAGKTLTVDRSNSLLLNSGNLVVAAGTYATLTLVKGACWFEVSRSNPIG